MPNKNYGFFTEPILPEDFLLGSDQSLGAKYGAEVYLNEKGDWTPYTPSTEDQSTNTGDTYSCVSHGTHNAVEMLARLRFQNSLNLSDRFLAKTSGTIVGQGNSPKKVADTLRHGWSVLEPEWPDVDTVEEFYKDIPQNLKTLAVARGAEFEFGYQYVPNTPTSIKAALRISPVCIAVTAWVEQGGVYVRGPFSENHWTTIIRVLENGNYLCFDSFYPFIKEVSPEACKSVAMSYYLNRNVVKESAFKKFIKLILAFFTESKPESITEPEPAPAPPVVPQDAPNPPIPTPTPLLGDEKLINALIQVESQGNDNAIGDKHLADKAYGCLQIRKPYITDANDYLGTNYKAQDCLGNRALSIKIFRAYMERYKLTTDEQKARAHNGGVSAARIGSTQWKATGPYWSKVKKLL